MNDCMTCHKGVSNVNWFSSTQDCLHHDVFVYYSGDNILDLLSAW